MVKDFQSAPESPIPQHPITRETESKVTRSPADESSTFDHGLNADLRDHVGTQLRAMFLEIAAEPLPVRFRQLLDGFAQKTQTTGDIQTDDKR